MERKAGDRSGELSAADLLLNSHRFAGQDLDERRVDEVRRASDFSLFDKTSRSEHIEIFCGGEP